VVQRPWGVSAGNGKPLGAYALEQFNLHNATLHSPTASGGLAQLRLTEEERAYDTMQTAWNNK
jgi:hypothetical protein